MSNFISRQFATNALLLIFSGVIIFHLLVITSIIPFELVWGGRMKDHQQMIQFEMVSILLNALMLAVVAIYAGYFKFRIKPMIITAALWFMFALFLLNTVGNMFSNNELEQIVFTPFTLILSILCLRLAIHK